MQPRRLVVFITVFLVFGGISRVMSQPIEAVVSLDLTGLTLPMALERIAEDSRVRFVVEPSLSTREGSSVNIQDVPLSRAIPIIAAAYGACAHDTGRLIRITACGH